MEKNFKIARSRCQGLKSHLLQKFYNPYAQNNLKNLSSSIKNIVMMKVVQKMCNLKIILVKQKLKLGLRSADLLKFLNSVFSIPRPMKVINEDHYFIHDQ